MKAKAKPKARAGGVRRPAGARAPARRGGGAVPRRMRLRRPAADPSGVAGRGGPTPWMKGEQVLLREVDPRDLVSGQVIVIQGLYFGNIVKLAAVVQKAEVEKGETYLQVKAQGTTSEELLKVHSGDPRAPFQIHCCPEHCSLHESGDRLVHGRTGYLLLEDAAREDWVNNLEAAIPVVEEKEDELRELRRRERDLEGMGLPVEDGKKKDHRKASSSRSSGNKRKKKKKRKEKKREKSKRRERSEGKEKDKRKRRDASHDGRSPVASSQKDLQDLFEGTGMDPRERIRLRVVRRARRFAARKKEKTSSSSSSSESSSRETEKEANQAEGLFKETSRGRAIHERFPGCCLQSLCGTCRRTYLQPKAKKPKERGRSQWPCCTSGRSSRERPVLPNRGRSSIWQPP